MFNRKVLLSILLVPLILVLVAVASLPYLLNTEWFKGTLNDELTKSIGREISIGEIDLRLGLSPMITLSEFIIKNPPQFEEVEMLKVGSMSLRAPLIDNIMGDFRVEEATLNNLKLFIDEDEEGKLNVDFTDVESGEPESAEEDGSPILPAISKFTAKDIDIVLFDDEEKREFFFHDITVKNINLGEPNSLNSSLKIDGVPITLGAGTSSIKEFLDGKDLKVDLDLKQEAHKIVVSGAFKENGMLDIVLDISGSDFSTLSSLFRTELPKWSDYKLKGRFVRTVTDESQTVKLSDIDFAIGKNDLSGDVELQLEPLKLRADLESKEFDLTALIPESKSEKEEKKEKSEKKEEPRIPYEIFTTLDADLDLDIAKLKTFLGLEFTKTHLAVDLEDGKLHLPSFSAGAFGGTFKGDLKLDAKEETMAFNIDGSGFEASPITLLASGEPIINGAIDFSADLTTKGSLISDVLKNLNGEIGLSSIDAEIKSATLQATSSGLSGILSPIFGDASKAEIECLIYDFDVKNGIAKSKEQVIKLGEAYIFAEGELDFPKNSMTYNFNVNSENPSVVSLIPPFRASGTLDSPLFTPSVSGSIASVVDTSEGIIGSATGLVADSAKFIVSEDGEELAGKELCIQAYKSEQSLLSSQVGSLLE